jgi:hypothetical protein
LGSDSVTSAAITPAKRAKYSQALCASPAGGGSVASQHDQHRYYDAQPVEYRACCRISVQQMPLQLLMSAPKLTISSPEAREALRHGHPVVHNAH